MTKLRATDRILATRAGDPKTMLEHIDGPDAKDRAYVAAAEKWHAIAGTDPFIGNVQWGHETGNPKTGAPAESIRWNRDLNPGGVAIPSDSTVQPFTIKSGDEAARIHVQCLYSMVTGHLHADVPVPEQLVEWFDDVWLPKVNHPKFPTVETVDDLNIRYTVDGEAHATWAWDATYTDQLIAKAGVWYPDLHEQNDFTTPVEPGTGGTMTKPTIILTAGHRSDNDTGNPDEKNRTQYLAQAYQAAFQAAGYAVHYVQNEDGDGRPDITSGGLDTVGQKTAAIMRSIDGPIVDLDLHYEGASARGVFAIVPDETGLVTAIAGGTPGDDTWGNNPLDVSLARAIAQEISKETGLTLRATTEPGVMSERATGVGIQGYRLATMAYSAFARDRAVRLVVEHGSLPTSDRDIILTNDFTQKCAKAAVRAVNTIYKQSPVKPPTPEPSKYAIPGWVPPRDGKDHEDAKGNLFRAIDRVVTVEGGTRFYAQASLKAKETRAPAPAQGMSVRIAWKMNSWYVTPVGSRFKIADSDLSVTFKDTPL